METKTTMPAEGSQLAYVNLLDIEICQTNKMFRKDSEMTEAALEDLIRSINSKGVIQPVLLRKGVKGKSVYELVCGERRVRASTFAGKETIPAYIRTLSDDDALECQITENLQREGINPMNEAQSFEWLIKTKKFTTEAISRKIGKSIDYVQDRLRLAKLKPMVQDLVRAEVLPMTAALKFTRVPDQLQEQAIRACTQTIEGAAGKQTIFTGLGSFQKWLEYHVFNELVKADFDQEDLALVPSAGGCSVCPKRTKNSGGLFSDITKKDFCLDGGCFRSKQLATYEKIRKEVTIKYPGAEIVYQERSWNAAKDFGKKLSPIIDSYKGKELTVAEVAKRTDAMGFLGKTVKIAILIGRHDEDASRKKFTFLSFATEKTTTESSSGKPDKAKTQKILDDQEKLGRIRSYENQLIAEAIIKKATAGVDPNFVRANILSIFSDSGEERESLAALKALGIDWVMTRGHGKKSARVPFKASEADLFAIHDESELYFDDRDLKSAISKVAGPKLNALLVWAEFSNSYKKDELKKILKIDNKAINQKAKDLSSKWWKEEQKKRAGALLEKGLKKGGKNSDLEKGLSKLLTK